MLTLIFEDDDATKEAKLKIEGPIHFAKNALWEEKEKIAELKDGVWIVDGDLDETKYDVWHVIISD